MYVNTTYLLNIMERHKLLANESWCVKYNDRDKTFELSITANAKQAAMMALCAIDAERVNVFTRCHIHDINFEKYCPLCHGQRCTKCAEMYYGNICGC